MEPRIRPLDTRLPGPCRELPPPPPLPEPPPEPRVTIVSSKAPLGEEAPAPPPPPVAAEPPKPRIRMEHELPETGRDPVEALFGDAWLRRASDRPVIVLASRPLSRRYEYLELLKRVVKEIYRVSARAQPLVQHVARRLTEYQLAMMRGGAAIYVVDADSVAEAEAGEAALSRLVTALEDRLREAYAQGFGFLVVYGSRPYIRRMRELWRPSITAGGMVYTRLPRPVEASVPETEELFRMVEAMYSLPEGSLRGAENVDEAVVTAEERLYSCLEGAANDPTLARVTRQAIDDEEARPDDAFIHYALKAVAVAQLLETGVRETSIETEVAVSNVPVDVLVRRGWSDGLVVEAETLTASVNPASRLSSVIRRVNERGYTAWIVLLPHTAAIYKPMIEPVAREASRYGSAEFYVLSPSNCMLKPIEEHYRRLDKVAAALAEARLGGSG